MSSRKCVACGTDPAEGFASTWQRDREYWYCHPDEGPSCYIGSVLGMSEERNGND